MWWKKKKRKVLSSKDWTLRLYEHRLKNLESALELSELDQRRYKHIKNFPKDGLYIIIDWFEKDKKDFAAIYKFKRGYGSYFYIYNIDKDSFMCFADTDISLKNKGIWINTLDATQCRQGYGTLCLMYIEKFALSQGIEYINGMLEESTQIGFDNLVRFYKKNKYDVYQNAHGKWVFYKNLI